MRSEDLVQLLSALSSQVAFHSVSRGKPFKFKFCLCQKLGNVLITEIMERLGTCRRCLLEARSLDAVVQAKFAFRLLAP